jgi:hypothetical protein
MNTRQYLDILADGICRHAPSWTPATTSECPANRQPSNSPGASRRGSPCTAAPIRPTSPRSNAADSTNSAPPNPDHDPSTGDI